MRLILKFLIVFLVSLLMACAATKPESVQVLLERAVKDDSISKATALLESGANPNQKSIDGSTAIFFVNSREMVDLLVGYGADVNVRNNKKQTPIFNVVNPDVLQALLTAGADVDVVDINGFTLSGLLQGFLEMAEIKPEVNRDKNIGLMRERLAVIMNHASRSDLLSYASAGKLVKVKSLIEHGASLDDVDNNGNSALHLAAKNSHDYVVLYLISKKLSLILENKEGKTPLDLVKNKKNSTAKILSCAQNKNCISVATFEKRIATACSDRSNIDQCMEVAEKDIHGVFISADIESRIVRRGYKN